jgi:hypothetical protein
MAHHKLLLDDDIKEDFSLVAIHCSEEAYKMAFTLNQHLHLRLKRKRADLDFSNDGLQVTFPIFKFEDQFQYTTYYLVSNKCKSIAANVTSSEGLFGDDVSESTVLTLLLPEFKQADFFLKIESDHKTIPLRKNVALINEIKQVISAYKIEEHQLKSNHNLIFN